LEVHNKLNWLAESESLEVRLIAAAINLTETEVAQRIGVVGVRCYLQWHLETFVVISVCGAESDVACDSRAVFKVHLRTQGVGEASKTDRVGGRVCAWLDKALPQS